MNRDKLDNRITNAFEKVCNEKGFYNEKTFEGKTGGTNTKQDNQFIHSLSISQIVTLGVPNNRFEISCLGGCTILQIENIWQDLYYLTQVECEFTEWGKKYIPKTYTVYYDKDKVRKAFPDNIIETSWLSFDISDKGIEQFEKVARFILEQDLIPKLEDVRTLQTLDEQLNSTLELGDYEKYHINEDGVLFRRMIVAKLVGNPNYEEICNHERKYFPDYIESSKEKGYEFFKNIPMVFEKVYERLKNITPAVV